jgi:hypothetical protein
MPLAADHPRFQHIGQGGDLLVQFTALGHAAGEHEFVEAIEIAVGDGLGLLVAECFGQLFSLKKECTREAVSKTRNSSAVKPENPGGD